MKRGNLMKWTNRQYVDLMTYNHPERPMFSELFGPIVGLAEEWRAQGATEDQIAMRGFAFDYVPYYQLGDLDSVHRPKEVVLEDNERYYVAIDHYRLFLTAHGSRRAHFAKPSMKSSRSMILSAVSPSRLVKQKR